MLMRTTSTILCAIAALGVTGCTTLNGGPANVLDAEDTPALVVSPTVSVSTREQIIRYYVGLPTPAAKTEFRNRVSDHYMGLIDRNYEHYATKLFSEGIETALGFDLAIIGLSATSTLFEEVASDLAAVISAYAGGQAAINKNLYFDRTLPALIATMDTERTRVETMIIARKLQTASDYSIEAAIRDLRSYQQAGTLMRAVTQVTQTAGEELAKAKDEKLTAIKYGCVPDATLRGQLIDIQLLVGPIVQNAGDGTTEPQRRGGRQALARIAKAYHVDVPSNFELAGTKAQVNALSAQMAQMMLGAGSERNFCTAKEIETLLGDLRQLGFVPASN